ncbi:hypothetical protein HDU79_005119 [Rhizoclosmatium sp. JEL0117]|nr:hypothetical protein HDU79_005119 [Rhizoclosmatium sp. JEL0117]
MKAASTAPTTTKPRSTTTTTSASSSSVSATPRVSSRPSATASSTTTTSTTSSTTASKRTSSGTAPVSKPATKAASSTTTPSSSSSSSSPSSTSSGATPVRPSLTRKSTVPSTLAPSRTLSTPVSSSSSATASKTTTLRKPPSPAPSSSSSRNSPLPPNPIPQQQQQQQTQRPSTTDAETNTDPIQSTESQVPSSEQKDSSDAADLKAQLTVLEAALDARDIEVLTLQNELDHFRAEASQKQNSFASELNTESVFDKLENENQALQRQLAVLRKDKEESVEAMREEMELMAKRIRSESSESTSNHESEVAVLNQTIAAQTKQLQAVLQEITQLKESNHAKDIEIARSTREYMALQNGISKAAMLESAKGDELQFARESIEAGRVRIHELETKVAELESMVAAASREFVEYGEERAALLAEIEIGQDAIEKVGVLNASLESAKQAFEAEKAAAVRMATVILENEKAEIKKELDQLRVAHEQELQFSELLKQAGASDSSQDFASAEALAAVAAASTEIEDLKAQIKEMHEVLLKAQEEHKSQITVFTQEKCSLLNQIEEGKQAIQQVKDLTANLESLQQSLDIVQSTSAEKAMNLETEKSALLIQLSQLRTDYEETSQSLTLLQQQLTETASKSSSTTPQTISPETTSTIHLLEKELSDTKTHLQTLQDRLTYTLTTLSDRDTQYAAMEAQYTASVSISYTYMNTIQQLNTKIQALEHDLQEQKERAGELNLAFVQMMESRSVAVNDEVAANSFAREQQAAAQQELAITRREVVRLEGEVDRLSRELDGAYRHVEVLEQNVSGGGLLLQEEEGRVLKMKAQVGALVSLLMRKREAAAAGVSVESAYEKAAFEKLVADPEIQRLAVDYHAQSKVAAQQLASEYQSKAAAAAASASKAIATSPLFGVSQLRIVNDDEL